MRTVEASAQKKSSVLSNQNPSPFQNQLMKTAVADLVKPKQNVYYEEKDIVLIQGDCIEVMKQIPDKTIDLIFADPPYNLSNGGITCHAGKMVSVNKGDWDKSKGFLDDHEFNLAWLNECKRILKPNGTIWVSGTNHVIYSVGYAMQLLGFKILNDIAWFKPNAAPNLSCRYFTHSHETLLWAAKDKNSRHTFHYKAMREENNGKQMRSVWNIPTPKPWEKKFGKHPTQKPIDLLKRIVLASTNKKDLILDPFTGSSTTGVAACLHKRRFIGIDKEKEYLDLSIKRFENLR